MPIQQQGDAMRTATDAGEFILRKALPKIAPLSMRTYDRAMAEGDLPYIKIGWRVLVKRSDVLAWLESHRRCLEPASRRKRVRAAA
jgi:excisionase family DNA binding protein